MKEFKTSFSFPLRRNRQGQSRSRMVWLTLVCFLLTLNLTSVFAITSANSDSNISDQKQAGKITVTGVVKDEFGDPFPGATVVVNGTSIGTVTGLDGEYTLTNVPEKGVLVFSFIGTKTQEIPVQGKTSIDVVLSEDSELLEEVIVTGYGGIQKAKTQTAAAVNVEMESITRLPVTSVSDGLGGRVTGIISQAKSGAPGETTKIWIRGGSNILYVIDDVVMETAQGEIFFNRLRPDDIASMSILKDASATAVYGPRANDGVVVVATKRGVSGQLDITVSQKVSVMNPSYRPEVMSSWDYVNAKNDLYAANMEENPAYNATQMSRFYMGHLNQQGHGQGAIMNMVNERFGLDYSSEEIRDLFDPRVTQGGNIQDYYQTYDPWDFFSHTQPMSQTNVGVRGGSDRVKYYTSLGVMNQSGISSSYGYEQYNAMVNTEALLLADKSLKFTLNVNGIMSSKEQPAGGDGIFNSILIEGSDMPRVPRNWSTGLQKSGGLDSRLNTGFNNIDDYRLQTSAGLKWSLPWVEGLSVGASVNFNHSYSMHKQFNHNEIGVYSNPVAERQNNFNPESASVRQDWNNYSLTTGIFQADYNRSFGKHYVSGMANYSSQVRNTNSTWASAKGYPTIFVPQVGAGATQTGRGGSEGNWGSASYVARVSYEYDEKYLFQGSANYNGSLSYSPDKRWGLFYAMSAGWVLTEEDFIKNIINKNIISTFKIRGGYGVVGKEIAAPYSYMNQYNQSGSILIGENMSAQTAWTEKQVANDLTWGESQQMSIALDFGFFQDKLTGSFDTYLYKNKGDKMNMNPSLIYTPILGMPNTPQINAPYETERKGGAELSLNWRDRVGDFSYRVGLTYTHWDLVTTRHTNESTDYYYPNLNNIGERDLQPTYSSGWTTSGIWGSHEEMYNSYLHFNRNHTVGTYRMNDLNGDGVLGIGDYMTNTRGGTTPQTIFGLTLGAGWKGFSIDVFVQGATDVTGDVPSPGRSQQGYFWNYGKYMYDKAYTPGNPDTSAPLQIPTSENRGWGYNYIDAWVFDASYIKLKNISLQYDMKRSVLKDVDVIKGLELSFIVNNVFTWVKSSNPLKNLTDPEYIPANTIWGGNKLGSYPTQRSYTLSATITL